jgi:organic radical activating enzyme
MNLAGTEYTLSMQSFDIYISGCRRKCFNCFNTEAQDFSFGAPLIFKELIKKIEDNIILIKQIRIMGGDLLEQNETEAILFSNELSEWLKNKNIKLVLYTGARKEHIPLWCFYVFNGIKYGPYVDSLKQTSSLYGSSNQKFITKGDDY